MNDRCKEGLLDRVCDNTVKAMQNDGILLEDINHDDKCIYAKISGNNIVAEIRVNGGFTPIDAIRVRFDGTDVIPYVESRLDKVRLASKNPKCLIRVKTHEWPTEQILDSSGQKITAGVVIEVDGKNIGKVVSSAGSDMIVVSHNGKLMPVSSKYAKEIKIVNG